MRPAIIWTIFRKEIIDSLRDRLTLLVVLGVPLLLYPLLIIGMTKLVDTQVAQQQMRVSKVALWGEATPALTNWLAKTTNHLALRIWAGAPEAVRQLDAGKLKPMPTLSRTNAQQRVGRRLAEVESDIEPENPVLAAAREVITRREYDAVLVVWPGFGQALAKGALGNVSIYYDSVRLGSGTAQQRLWDELAAFRKAQLRAREQERGLAEGFTKAVEIMPRNVAVQTRRGGQFIGSFLPLFLIMLSAIGALNAAIDLTAGEKIATPCKPCFAPRFAPAKSWPENSSPCGASAWWRRWLTLRAWPRPLPGWPRPRVYRACRWSPISGPFLCSCR